MSSKLPKHISLRLRPLLLPWRLYLTVQSILIILLTLIFFVLARTYR